MITNQLVVSYSWTCTCMYALNIVAYNNNIILPDHNNVMLMQALGGEQQYIL
jgi:hypothetical protein